MTNERVGGIRDHKCWILVLRTLQGFASTRADTNSFDWCTTYLWSMISRIPEDRSKILSYPW